ncbi:MAG: endonuclease/exonuclease/phosphatase family protein [Clostridia bacterium]|nr:endonuclease/exonuclease/phosphatase family protein [Clostridia bacterium]
MELKIISFNIRCCDDKDGNSIKERAPRLLEVTRKYDADIIGFQEFTVPWENEIAKFYPEYEMYNKYRSTSELEGAPILWKKDKFECLDKGYFWLSDTPEVESRGWDTLYNCYRMCQYVTLRHIESGKVFTHMNTHYGFGDKGQIDSSRLIYEYSKKISKYPIFITGDFNMRPTSLGYNEMVKHFADVNEATARDRRTTYHGYGTVDNEHIDYCFINEEIKPISLRLIDETIDGKYPSDHYGLFIRLDI